MRLFILTHSPSPYQVELFDQIARDSGVTLTVAYLFGSDPDRKWNRPVGAHRQIVLKEGEAHLVRAGQEMSVADLAVFNYYVDAVSGAFIRERAALRRPWCFWGERPGFRRPVLGVLGRRWKLRALHRCRAPIWGIGRFAVEQYRREFGGQRAYHDIPYFSDLARFAPPATVTRDPAGQRTFLFSGALIERKGVDLLARAFRDVAAERSDVRLKVLGDGPLRARVSRLLEPVARQVEFLGFKDWPELPAVYHAADFLCVPSRHDGWGLVVPEGLAAGLPVIGTDRTGAAIEFLQNGSNGWLVPAGDEAALRAALREAASLPEAKLGEMRRAALESVSAHTLEEGARRFLAAAREAVARWPN
jgi:glycosyltransferase involved in cell wall biosynthesis